ncbi:hypothetical protein PIB30_097168, partial [Stylosanthes scabra]|nr:hypothetical protein [Stylosanthes scabra]
GRGADEVRDGDGGPPEEEEQDEDEDDEYLVVPVCGSGRQVGAELGGQMGLALVLLVVVDPVVLVAEEVVDSSWLQLQ